MKKKDRFLYVLTLVFTILALGMIVYFSFGTFYSVAREDAVKLGENSVSEEAAALNNFLLKGLDVVQVTGITIDYMMKNGKTAEEIEQFLLQQSADYAARIDASYTGIYGVFDDVYIDGIGWVPDADYVPQDRPWYQAAIEGQGAPVIVSPYLDAQTGSIMISVSQMLSDGKSVVSLDIVMDGVQEVAKNIRLNGNGYGFILDNNGLVVAHSDESQKGKNFLDPAESDAEMVKLVEKVLHADGASLHTELDGESCMVFSKVVQNDWYVVMIVNNSDLFRKVRSNLVQNIVVSIIIFAGVLFFCTSSYWNHKRAAHYADKVKDYQMTLEERVLEQTQEIKKQTEQLVRMQEDVIEGMATLIESRDGNTGEHVRNTKKYVTMIVSYMYRHHMFEQEIDDVFVEQIGNAAALHDIGKIQISDTILNKPGKFTPEEYEIMKSHSRLGGEIVGKILGESADEKLIQISKDVVNYHHEKWDGTGYPAGLKGEEIPLSARIMAVADVFDALVSKRVYKDSMPTEQAFEILKQDAGKHFDPQIVDIFLGLQDEIREFLKQKQLNGEM